MDQTILIEKNTNTSPISVSKEELKRIKHREYIRKYREKHPDWNKEYAKKYRESHPGYNNKYVKKWASLNKDKIKLKYNERKLKKALDSGNFADILCAYISYNPLPIVDGEINPLTIIANANVAKGPIANAIIKN